MSEIRVNTIVAAEGTSAPNLPYGIQVPTGMGITGAGGLNITGVATATSFVGNITGTVTGNATGLTGTPNISCGTIAGSTGTFSGAVNVDATTDSTSTTTGALIVDGGAAIAKNVYIGAGLSVAGTLTYEDVTSVDSVGLITAKSGVNVTGGQLQVGVAYSVGATGISTGLGFVCGSSGFNGEAGTSNFGALNVGNAGEFKVGTAVTISSTAGVTTFSGDVIFDGATEGRTITFDKSDNALKVADDTNINIGTGNDLSLFHNGSQSTINDTANDLRIGSDSLKLMTASGKNEYYFTGVEDGAVTVYYDNSAKLATTNDGVSITGMSTVTTGAHFQGMLREDCNIVANKLSAGTNIDLEDGMVHYYSTNETTTATPNIRWNSSYSLNNKMSVGEIITVTIIYKPNGAGYYAQLTIDGSASTEEWNGGSAPSSANAGGYDVLTHTIIKTGSGSWINLSNVQNYA